MNKGNTAFGLVITYTAVFMFATILMAGTGWTGLTHSGTFVSVCSDGVDCLVAMFSNMIALMTFQSQYYLFNLFLGVFYVIFIIAIIGIVTGAI